MKKYLLLLSIAMFLGSCVQDKYVCGSKSQHKKRSAKMRSMAPTMAR